MLNENIRSNGYLCGNFVFMRIAPNISRLLMFALLLMPLRLHAQLNKAYFFYKGEEFMSKGQYSRALPYFNTLIGIDSTLAEGWFLRGVAKLNLGDVHGALSDLQRCTAVNPLLSQAYNAKSMALNRIGRHNQALAEVLNAIDLKPNSTDYRYTLGVTYLYLNDYSKAQEAFSRIIKFDKTIPEAWINRGVARQYAADTAGAFSDYNRAIVLNPFSAYAYLRRGALHLDQKQFDLALADLNQSVALDSTVRDGFFVRSMAHYQRGDLQQALADLNHVVRLAPDYPLGLFNRAIVLYELNEWQQAIVDLNNLSALNPENVLVYYNRANMQLDHGRVREAIADYTTAINIFPDFANAYLNRALAKHKLGDARGAHADHLRGQQLLAKYQNEGTADGMMSLLDSSGNMRRLISLESDFNAAMRFGMRSNRVKVTSAFLPLARLALARQVDTRREPDALLEAINAQLPSQLRVVLRISEVEHSAYPVAQIDSLLAGHRLHQLVRGLALADEGMYSEAHTALLHAQKLAPTHQLVRLTATAIEVDMARYVERFANGGMSISRAAADSTQLTMTAYRDAADSYGKLQRQAPHNAHVMYNLGNIHVLLSDYAEAIYWYDQVLATSPRFAAALYNRGLAHLLSGQQQRGCEDLSRAGELGITQAYEALRLFCDR